MSNYGRGGAIITKPLFVVKCERIPKRAWYKVSFLNNNQLTKRIKDLPPSLREYDVADHCWHMHLKGLYDVMKKYRRSEKIKFEFGVEERLYFIEQIKKIDEIEVEKVNKIEALKLKNVDAIKFKDDLEKNFKEYEAELLSYLKPGVVFYPYQIVAAMFLKRVRSALLSMEMGLGKAEKIDSKLLTPNGWIIMGDVKIGDQIIGSNGRPCTVIGVYPQGKKEIYRIWFNDKTYVETCDEHLWAVNSATRINRTKNGNNKYPFRILSLRQIMNEGLTLKNGNRKHYIPIVKPIEFEEKKLLIDPYLLGCLLGDGGLTQRTPTITSIDGDLLNEIENRLPNGTKLNGNYKDFDIVRNDTKIRYNPLTKLLDKYQLSGTNSYTKFIPNYYQFASIDQRLELLRGLLDTDGHIFKNGSHIEITLASKQLIEDLQFIVQSLGGIGRIKEKWITYNGERRMYYRMGIKLPPQFIPFKLSRKIERYKPVTKYLPNRAITKIEYIGEHEAQCIAVDALDHLYLTNHCIVTHNTLCSIAYVEMMGFNRVFVITPNSLKFNYYDEVMKFAKEGTKAHIINYKDNKYTLKESKYIIVNYDYFNSSNKDRVLKKFEDLDLGFMECVICDESHMLKNTAANTYKNFKKIFKDVPCKVFLSGTPAPNRAKELYTVFNQIAKLDFPTKKFFYETYCGMIQDKNARGGWKYVEGMAKLEELFHKSAPYTYRKRKADVLKDLPDKIYNRILIEMTPEQQATYDKIEEGVANEIFGDTEMSAVNILTIMLRLRQYTSLLKIEPALELVKRLLDEGEKSVVVDMFKPPLMKLREKLGDVAVLHTGDQDSVERNDMKNDFQNPNGKAQVFLASIQTTKYGLTLTAASKMFMLALPFSVGEYDQVADRLHRIGQKDTVFIYPLIVKGSIDEHVFNIIENKRVEVTKVIDNEDYVSKVDESVLSEILAILKKKYKK